MLRFLITGLAVTVALASARPALAASFLVTTTADDVDALPGDGFCATSGAACTLRAAIQESNALPGSDSITLPAGTYTLTVTGLNEENAASGDLDISAPVFDDLAIAGAGAATTIIDAAGIDRVFHNCPSGYNCVGNLVEISDVTIRGGDAAIDSGGGIRNRGNLRLVRTVVTDNNATVSCGGGIHNVDTGMLRMIDSTVSGNTCSGTGGGGICVNFGAMAHLSGTTITDNHATGSFALGGGLLSQQGEVTLTNCTVSGNTSDGGGGGLFSYGGSGFTRISLNNVTVTDNTAGTMDITGFGGGGVGAAYFYGLMMLRNSIIAGNTDLAGTAPDCGGEMYTYGYNLIGSLAGYTFTFPDATDLLGASVGLGPLQNNGGLTDTHALLTGSAIDGGNPGGCEDWVFGVLAGPVATDQRGIPRPQGAACDIGAYELAACGDGTVAPGEQCDDGNVSNGDCCSATCQFEALGNPCTDDGAYCTGVESCDGAGACVSAGDPCPGNACNTCQEATDSCFDPAGTSCPDDGNICTQDACDGSGTCAHDFAPAPTCKTAQKSLLLVKDDASDDSKDKVIWKWNYGQPTDVATELSDPTATTDYTLCVYDATGLLLRADVMGDNIKWAPLGDKGYKYKDPGGTVAGITKVILKGSSDNKAKALVKGKGNGLFDPTLGDVPVPITAQLLNHDTGLCMGSVFNSADVVKNTTKLLKAKAQQ